MRKRGAAAAVLLVSALLIGSTVLTATADDPPELEQGGWERPTIDSAQLELKNSTGMFRFDLDASGTSPEGTDRVEITFGGLNGSKIEVAEDLWFVEGVVFLFMFGSTLEQVEGEYPWSDWSFNIWFSIPSEEGIEGAISQMGEMFGLDTENLTMEENGNFSMDDMGIEDLTEVFQENRFYLIARSYNETGAWGQEAFDLTDHLFTAVLQFMIDEGLIEGPITDDDDPGSDDDGRDKEGISSWIMVGIFIIGITSLIAVISVVTYLAISSKKKEQ